MTDDNTTHDRRPHVKIGEVRPLGDDERRIASREDQRGREVDDQGGPVEPRRDEGMEVAEGALHPDVDAALLGVSGGQLDRRERLRHIEEEEAQHPEHEYAGTVFGREGGHAHGSDACDIEEHQVAGANDLLKLAFLGARLSGDRLSGHLLSIRLTPSGRGETSPLRILPGLWHA